MRAMERLQDPRGEKPLPPPAHPPPAEPSLIEAQLTQSPAAGRAKLRPLLKLAPYVARYRGRAFLALVALTIADGYHRVCASYHLDENADIPCRMADMPPVAGTG